MLYLRVLERFLTSVLLSKDEYNIRSKHFNPLRLIITTILVLNVMWTVVLLNKMLELHDIMEDSCPAVLAEIRNGR